MSQKSSNFALNFELGVRDNGFICIFRFWGGCVDHYCDGLRYVYGAALHADTFGCGVSDRSRHLVCDGCAGCERGAVGYQSDIGSGSGRAVCSHRRIDAYRCAAMDREASVGYAERVCPIGTAVDVTGSRVEFVLEQHDRRGAICEHRQDVVKETGYLAIQTAYSAQLCFGNGRCLYLDRYAA